MTQQCHARDTNIHAILSKYRTSGIIPRQVQKEYGDEVPADFQDAMFSGARLRSAYESLPDDERSTTTYADFLAGLAGHAEGEESPSSPADTEATADGAEGTSEASKNSERDSLPGASDQLPT